MLRSAANMLSFVVQTVYTNYAQNNNKRLLTLDRSFFLSFAHKYKRTHIWYIESLSTHTEKSSRYPLHIYRAIPNVRSRSMSRTESLWHTAHSFSFSLPFCDEFIYQNVCIYYSTKRNQRHTISITVA